MASLQRKAYEQALLAWEIANGVSKRNQQDVVRSRWQSRILLPNSPWERGSSILRSDEAALWRKRIYLAKKAIYSCAASFSCRTERVRTCLSVSFCSSWSF